MKTLIVFLCVMAPYFSAAQNFNFAGKDAVKVPLSVSMQLKKYIEVHDGIPLTNDNFAYVPVFNVLNRSEKHFIDGVYFFTSGSHDSGRLFISFKGKTTILRNNSIEGILADYTVFIKNNNLPELTQLSYLNAISSFMRFRYNDQKMLTRSGALQELK